MSFLLNGERFIIEFTQLIEVSILRTYNSKKECLARQLKRGLSRLFALRRLIFDDCAPALPDRYTMGSPTVFHFPINHTRYRH